MKPMIACVLATVAFLSIIQPVLTYAGPFNGHRNVGSPGPRNSEKKGFAAGVHHENNVTNDGTTQTTHQSNKQSRQTTDTDTNTSGMM